MVEFLGWLGLLLLIGTLMPFFLRRLHLWQREVTFLARIHHYLALTCLVVLTLHGLWALNGRRGWGAWIHVKAEMISGVLTWSILLAVCMLALTSLRQKRFSRTHCWLVGLLVLLVFYHI
ncbi:hypothetical protein SAMN02745219_00885 [Desulfofundulus thermosubterraneus DSM 16057]|uniref:Ferric reductase like transmembrane component n=1 Tax=Desulfofundulus thermosubterraneus DSM 16057 TaxID=1121432 RepID=A0A1M6DAP8_9FIRM|nr:hypothetical protein SAMN02745219_00885 [Desulfofundulus thermosubterraneus DSM 16057]